MANLKISELPVASLPLNADDLLAVVQTGTTSQIAFSGIGYSYELNSAQQEDFSTTPLQTLSASGVIGQRSIDVSGQKNCLVIFSVTYKCLSGTTADSQIQLRRDGNVLGVNTFVNIGTTDFYTATIQQRDTGSAVGTPGTIVYDGWFERVDAEIDIYAYSITVVEL